jgi:hypothetical protein
MACKIAIALRRLLEYNIAEGVHNIIIRRKAP